MSDSMVHRGADASGPWVSEPDARGWGALLDHALHPRPLARRCPAHGGPSDRGSGCPKRLDLYNISAACGGALVARPERARIYEGCSVLRRPRHSHSRVL
jgi:hypothetical protein